MTQLAAITLPELQNLKKSSRLLICYLSENDYYIGGVYPHVVEDYWYKNHNTTLSKQARQLFDLIYEYNSFTGIYCWYEWWGMSFNRLPDFTLPPETHHYTQFCPLSGVLTIEIQSSPSNHERIAALELQEWLQGKLPEEEIKSYFEAG